MVTNSATNQQTDNTKMKSDYDLRIKYIIAFLSKSWLYKLCCSKVHGCLRMLDFQNQEVVEPPKILYKYVTRERIDILRNANIRFTPLNNTNDIFEVRESFELVFGPQMKSLAETKIDKFNIDEIDEIYSEELAKRGLDKASRDAVRNYHDKIVPDGFVRMLKSSVKGALPDVFRGMNSPKSKEKLSTKFGNDLICLSMTDRFDISPMWAHYAANSTGFVIAFDTSHSFFQSGENQKLWRVAYFDGKIPALDQNPEKALISKQKDWAYEREWRIYRKREDASHVISGDKEDIHLIDFPTEMVTRVILGLRASSDLEEELGAIIAGKYPNVSMTRVYADCTEGVLKERPVG